MNSQPESRQLNPVLVALCVFVIMFFAYVGFVALWQQTSPGYPPVNSLDLAVKTPPNSQNWLERRGHGL